MKRPPIAPIAQVREVLGVPKPGPGHVITIVVPMPPKCLSPNSRDHWGVKAKAKQAARKAAWYQTSRELAHFYPAGWPVGPVTLSITVRGPRQSDGDNVQGRLKAVFDGIADALAMNDRDFAITPPVWERRGTGGNKYQLADPTDVEIAVRARGDGGGA